MTVVATDRVRAGGFWAAAAAGRTGEKPADEAGGAAFEEFLEFFVGHAG